MKRSILAAAIAALALGACAQQRAEQPPQAAAAPDDDAYCQAKGLKPGSDDYAKCRKERDYAASLQSKREAASQQKLGDFMMDHR